MAEYINRASLINNLITFAPEHYTLLLNNLILKEPAADVQPVVRCINCKHYEGLACCKLIGDCGGTNWFCGWGESKEEI